MLPDVFFFFFFFFFFHVYFKLLMSYLVYESHGKRHGPTILGNTVIKMTYLTYIQYNVS